MIVTVQDVCRAIEEAFPLSLQESYDNSGLQVGDPLSEVTGVLLSLDVTEHVVEEAVRRGCNFILSHHPLLFRGLKSVTGRTYEERVVMLAIRNGVAIYAAHTNLDNHPKGLNYHWAKELGLTGLRPLLPMSDQYCKVQIYVPESHAQKVRDAMAESGWGEQGLYDSCTFSHKGEGRFRALEGANPYCGSQGEVHVEPEIAVSTVVPRVYLNEGLKRVKAVHPYEEIAMDILPLEVPLSSYGAGILGELPEEISIEEFWSLLRRDNNSLKQISHSNKIKGTVRKVALCGGSGAFLLKHAIRAKADVFITGEAKYNDYLDAKDTIILATIGHYESEIIALKCFRDVISQKFSNFALCFSETNQNPIHYIH
ncbi:MAG: Nif3-like dinuclear metal center hexameric protein [Porphyromonas sp.]|nr:Nif3-like dinuclear metal center hexameric protein [Porphyromonas sp.]